MDRLFLSIIVSFRLPPSLQIHKDHTAAVTDVAYAPTGREFVSGSYDRTVRIFEADKGHSREVYHTKRMQRLTCVTWSADNRWERETFIRENLVTVNFEFEISNITNIYTVFRTLSRYVTRRRQADNNHFS